MTKLHKNFLYREFTIGEYRLVYAHRREEYQIVLQQYVDRPIDQVIGWDDVGLIAHDVAFDRIEPVWVFLLKQDLTVWLNLKVI